jgi:hypothetical protein
MIDKANWYALNKNVHLAYFNKKAAKCTIGLFIIFFL